MLRFSSKKNQVLLYHIFEINKRVIDRNHFDFGVQERSPQDNAANATKSTNNVRNGLVIHMLSTTTNVSRHTR